VLKAGTAGCSGTVANGSSIDTSRTGSHTFKVTATDNDGQATTVTSTYTVTAPLAPTLLGHTALVTSGHAKIKVACRQATSCTGKVQILTKDKHNKRVVVAGGSYSIGAGKTVRLNIALTGKGKALLKEHHGRLHATLKFTPAGGTPTTLPLTLRQAKKH
jgi:hypothetical protein